MHYLVTGSAGFIGFHVAERLLQRGHTVTGIDGYTDYYDPALKARREAILKNHTVYTGHRFMLEDRDRTLSTVMAAKPDRIIHLAAQAGVRYALDNPAAYLDANLSGLFSVMEAARRAEVEHLLFASTSSVYGAPRTTPFRETQAADRPLSFYAATKKAGEVLLHSWSHLYGLPVTAFRFFTVYGPWGRPDMAPFKFVDAIANKRPIEVFNQGHMRRDFTYIDDIAEAIGRLADLPPVVGQPVGDVDTLSPDAPFRVVNIGRGTPVRLMDFIASIERAMGMTAHKELLPMQPGDVPETYAATDLLKALTGFTPQVPLDEGIARLVAWYRGQPAVAQ
ncbi:MAG: NAD-dependent epimerase/dehydratase family protein [Beijerinckiaceae bacterium]